MTFQEAHDKLTVLPRNGIIDFVLDRIDLFYDIIPNRSIDNDFQAAVNWLLNANNYGIFDADPEDTR